MQTHARNEAHDEPRPNPERVFIYQVDADDRITNVSNAWLHFATENGVTSLGRDDVVGRRLWEFIGDLETRHLYGLIFERVRATQASRLIPFRCDSPDCRRFMELEIAAAPDGRLDLAGRLLRKEARSRVDLLDPSHERSGDLLSICGWCKRVETTVDDGEWCEVEDAVARLGLFDSPRLPQLSHVTCPECASRAREALRS